MAFSFLIREKFQKISDFFWTKFGTKGGQDQSPRLDGVGALSWRTLGRMGDAATRKATAALALEDCRERRGSQRR
jgi:hypothetical protein